LSETTPCVLIEQVATDDDHRIGTITLNAERSLNALTIEMILPMLEALEQWQHDERVVCVWLQGQGSRGFCAGGDVRALYRSMLAHPGTGPSDTAQAFFSNEYALNYRLHGYPKPIVCWGHGVVMGGGLGLMMGARHRVVTESSRLAMPEIRIGLYPDVGGSWFLNRLPGQYGLFLGLTGAVLNAADACFVGWADRFILQAYREAVWSSLVRSDWRGSRAADDIVHAVLQQYTERSINALPAAQLQPRCADLQHLMDAPNLPALAINFRRYQTDSVWLQESLASFESGCPSTACLVYQQLHRLRYDSLATCFQKELAISLRRVCSADFMEGVRALLIDKDAKPKWQYASIAEVPDDVIAAYFELE